MANPTANRAYAMPASTDLVTNLPAKFATFGDAVDLDIATDGGYTTTPTAAGTTTLTKASNRVQFFTGATTQDCVLPVVTTLNLGQRWRVVNKSSGVVTVKSSGSNTVYAVPAGASAIFTCILITGATAASWSYAWDGSTTAPAGALVKILAATFSSVANTGTTFDGVFTATYSKYIVMFSKLIASAAGEMQFNWRVAAATQAGNNYYGARFTQPRAGAVVSLQWAPATFHSPFPLSTDNTTNMTMNIYNVGISAQPTLTAIEISNSAGGVAIVGGENVGALTADGFILTPNSGTMSGTVTVYGVQE